jgi:hypothetical protein
MYHNPWYPWDQYTRQAVGKLLRSMSSKPSLSSKDNDNHCATLPGIWNCATLQQLKLVVAQMSRSMGNVVSNIINIINITQGSPSYKYSYFVRTELSRMLALGSCLALSCLVAMAGRQYSKTIILSHVLRTITSEHVPYSQQTMQMPLFSSEQSSFTACRILAALADPLHVPGIRTFDLSGEAVSCHMGASRARPKRNSNWVLSAYLAKNRRNFHHASDNQEHVMCTSRHELPTLGATTSRLW